LQKHNTEDTPTRINRAKERKKEEKGTYKQTSRLGVLIKKYVFSGRCGKSKKAQEGKA